MISIRKAEVQDAAAISHVHVQSWLSTYAGLVPAEYLASLNEVERIPLWVEAMTRGICVYVAVVEGVVVGFISGGRLREPVEEYEAELYAIYLLQDAQGNGIGRRLVDALAGFLVAEGFRNMLVWVLEQNPAVGFYEKAGAQRVESKQIEIGGALLDEVALGWADLKHSFPNV